MKKLPRKLSALLRLAVEDAQICEQTPGYVLDMSRWHEPSRKDKVCRVCMAGAVMAVEQQVPWSAPDQIPDDGRLQAINAMRTGEFGDAYLDAIGSSPSARLGEVLEDIGAFVYSSYYLSPGGRAPWPVYLAVAARLEKSGL